MININSSNYKSNNIFSEKELIKKLNKIRKKGKKIGLCTGSFDILHPGHITHFDDAKKICDILVVAIALDSFSTQKKTNLGRPIFSQDLRAFIVSKLKPVDFVFLHDGSAGVINIVKPDIYFKGPDYSNGKDLVVNQQIKMMEKYGGKIHYTEAEKLSTTEIINHIKEQIK